jgi:flagellin
MALVVHQNLAARRARYSLSRAHRDQSTALERMSSGMRLNRSSDDTTAYALSTRLASNIESYTTAGDNAKNGLSLVRSLEGTATEMLGVIDRMRQVATQAATGTLTDKDRVQAQIEFTALQSEIQRLAQTTHVNGIQGVAVSTQLTFQVGIRSGVQNRVVVTLSPMTLGALSIGGSGVSTQGSAQIALSALIGAETRLIELQTRLGARYNELSSAENNAMSQVENLNVTYASMRDADYAVESGRLAQAQIRSQAGVSLLAQANTLPQLALQLLR